MEVTGDVTAVVHDREDSESGDGQQDEHTSQQQSLNGIAGGQVPAHPDGDSDLLTTEAEADGAEAAWTPFAAHELHDAIATEASSNGITRPSSVVNGYSHDMSSRGPSSHLPTGVSSPHAPSKPTELKYKPRMTLRGHKKAISAVKFSPDGEWVASCSADCTIKIWNASSGALEHTLDGHLAGISTIAWSPDSKTLASGSDDKTIRLWDVDSGKCRPTPFIGHSNYVYSIAFSPKGNMLASGSYDEALFLWDVRTARVMRSLPAHSDPVSGVDFVRDGSLVASGSHDGVTRIWDAGTGMCLKTLVHADNKHVTSVRFSPNGKYVLTASLDSCLRLWDYVENRCVKTFQGHKNVKYSINACFGTYGPDESDGDDYQWAFVAVGDEEGSTYLWDVSSKEILQVLHGHEGTVFGVDVCNVSGEIATAGIDGTIKVWTDVRRLSDRSGPNEHATEL